MENSTLKQINEIVIAKHLSDAEIPVIPLKDKVILKPITSQQITEGGLILVEMNKSNRPMGRIVAVGPACSTHLKKGMVVVFDPTFDFPLVINGINYIMLNEPFIDAIVSDEKKVHVPLEAVTGDQIKRVIRHENVTRVRKQNAVDYDNKMDEYHEKSKDRAKNPILTKHKRK